MVGKKKALVMEERLKKINPQARIEGVPLFYNAENSDQLLARKPQVIIDAIDNITAKAFLIATARKLGIPLITSTGASARMDPTKIQVVDLAETHTDPLAHQVRKVLRQKYDFPEGLFGVPAVFSTEKPMEVEELNYDNGEGFKCVCPQGQNDLHSCLHRNVIYGNASFVTGAFGLATASWVVRTLIAPRSEIQ